MLLRVIIIEDSEDDTLLSVLELKKGGYEPVHIRVETAEELRKALRDDKWDLIICGHALPRFSFPEALAVLQESGRDLPFIAVSALKTGAHDLITKENLSHLTLAVERELRDAALRVEYRRAEERLRENEAVLAALYRNAPVIMMLLDQERKVSKLNTFAAEFTGQSAAEMTGMRGGETLHCLHWYDDPAGCGFGPVCRQCMLRQTVIDTFETGRSHDQVEINYPVMIKGKVKEAFFLLSTEKLVIGNQPRVLICLLHIAERKQLEKALRTSEARFRLLAENAKDIIFRIELLPQIHFNYISQAVSAILGYAQQEIYNNPALIQGIINQSLQGFDFSNSDFYVKPFVFQCRHKDNSDVWLELYLSPFFNDAGRLAAIEGIAHDVTERELKEKQLKSSYAKIEALSNRILRAMEEERARLARELHDEVGQALTAVKLDLQLLSDELSAFQRQKEKLLNSIELVDTTLQLVRRQSVSLRPPVLDDMGLESAIREMARGFKNRTGIQTIIRVHGFPKRLPRDMETALYRCVQESFTNVARHAKATKVTVDLILIPGVLSIRVEDDGIGFQPDELTISPDHIGLTGIQERVKLLRGKIGIESGDGRGTRIVITVPWHV
ncbi:MAG: PAS domain S-box protein [Bacillota bacterium]